MFKKVVLYARYSSDNQREESIDAQLRACHEYCKQKGYVVAHEYIDEAFTGTNDQRPAFQQLLKDAKSGTFSTVIFHKIDRNARNEYDYYFHKMQLQKCAVHYEYVTQNIDDSPEGQMMESVMVGMAAYYSRNLSKEVQKGKRENAYKGLYNGGGIPLGFDVVDKKFVVNEDEAKIVRLIFKLYLNDYSYGEIINLLHENGYKSKRGGKFSKNSIFDILANKIYIGTLVYGKSTAAGVNGKRNSHKERSDAIIVEKAVMPIIDAYTFQRVAEKKVKKRRLCGSYNAKINYLLSGLIRCGYCNNTMIGRRNRREKGDKVYEYLYYRCGSQDRYGVKACESKEIKVPLIEKFVLNCVSRILFSADSVERLIEKTRSVYAERIGSVKDENLRLSREKQKLSLKLDRLYDLVESGTADEFDLGRMRKIKSDITAVNNQLAKLDKSTPDDLPFDLLCKLINQYKAVFESGTLKNIKSVLNTFIKDVLIYKEKITINFKIDFCGVVPASSSPPLRIKVCDIWEQFTQAVMGSKVNKLKIAGRNFPTGFLLCKKGGSSSMVAVLKKIPLSLGTFNVILPEVVCRFRV